MSGTIPPYREALLESPPLSGRQQECRVRENHFSPKPLIIESRLFIFLFLSVSRDVSSRSRARSCYRVGRRRQNIGHSRAHSETVVLRKFSLHSYEMYFSFFSTHSSALLLFLLLPPHVHMRFAVVYRRVYSLALFS